MHVIAHSSTHAPRSASSAHCAALRFGPARSSVACVSSTWPRREVAHDRVVLGRAHVAGREDRAVIEHECEHLGGLGQQRAVVVGDRDARARKPELRTDAAVVVLAARQRRQPHDARAEAERDLDGRRVHAADLAVAADAAEHRDAGNHLPDRPRQRRGREVVRLQHDGPVPRGGGLTGLERPTDRSGCASGPKWQCRSAAPAGWKPVLMRPRGTSRLHRHAEVIQSESSTTKRSGSYTADQSERKNQGRASAVKPTAGTPRSARDQWNRMLGHRWRGQEMPIDEIPAVPPASVAATGHGASRCGGLTTLRSRRAFRDRASPPRNRIRGSASTDRTCGDLLRERGGDA